MGAEKSFGGIIITMRTESYQRVLAVEIRCHRAGYAILEGDPIRLTDYGIVSLTTPLSILEWLKTIVTIYSPSVIVAKRPRHRNKEYTRGMNTVLFTIQAEAFRQSTPIETIPVDTIKCCFRDSCKTKEDIAATIAKTFHELQWKLPPMRKPWTSEGHNMAIFDAVATGLAYLTRFDEPTGSP